MEFFTSADSLLKSLLLEKMVLHANLLKTVTPYPIFPPCHDQGLLDKSTLYPIFRPEVGDLRMGCSLDICEIYETLMGESVAAGWPCTLIRMGGCNLNCTYCDTPYARHEYRDISLEKIMEKVRHPYPHHVLVTGGEPLLQSGTPGLLQTLLEQGHKVYIETNGSLDIRLLDPRVLKVMDLKCPSSGENKKNLFQNIRHLTPQDEIKFVICDKTDFRWAKKILKRYEIQKYATVLFSPAAPHLDPKLLAKWILEEELEVRFQIQLHKILWGEKRGI